MADNKDKKLRELLLKLEELTSRQDFSIEELNDLRLQISRLQEDDEDTDSENPINNTDDYWTPPPIPLQTPPPVPNELLSDDEEEKEERTEQYSTKNLETTIGTNWISKIGIVLLLIGVFIGGTYLIENDIITPLMRIVLGYLGGAILMALGFYWKKKYNNYSAVLMSGSLAVFYIITFFAYSYYDYFSQPFTFGLMILIAAAAVFISLKFNRSVIANIGLVGAYAIPFLLSTGSNRYDILFSYVLIVNLGVLIIAFKRYWKSLYYVSFFFSWLIFFAVQISEKLSYNQPSLFFAFLTAFFLIFAAVGVIYRLRSEVNRSYELYVVLFLNSLFFYFFAYHGWKENMTDYAGLSALFISGLHIIAAFFVRHYFPEKKNLFNFFIVLAFLILVITIPRQLTGAWIGMSWMILAVVLFWLGRKQKIVLYEYLALGLLPFIILNYLVMNTWLGFGTQYKTRDRILNDTLFLNFSFFCTLVITIGFGIIAILNDKRKDDLGSKYQAVPFDLANLLLPLFFILSFYQLFAQEIDLYFSQLAVSTNKGLMSNYDFLSKMRKRKLFLGEHLYQLNIVWQLIYATVLFAVFSLINIRKIKSIKFALVLIPLTSLAVIFSMTKGIISLGHLREMYLNPLALYSDVTMNSVLIRYFVFAGVALSIYSFYLYLKEEFMKTFHSRLKLLVESSFYIILLVFLSNELITWLDIMGYPDVFKWGLSVLWGVYSVLLVIIGLLKNNKYQRISAILLFAITLIKLLYYDLGQFTTLGKTLVLIIFGVLLLIASFFYNKFQNRISNSERE